MAEAVDSHKEYTSTVGYPDYASKAAFLADLKVAHQESGGSVRGRLASTIARLSNTDTDDWTSDSTVRAVGF
jgi:hypothetical protein